MERFFGRVIVLIRGALHSADTNTSAMRTQMAVSSGTWL
jgi:hypothetical protein